MTTDTDEQQPTEPRTEATGSATEPHRGSPAGRLARRVVRARIGRVPVAGLLAAVAIMALLGTAYSIGTPTAGTSLDGERAPSAMGAAPGAFNSVAAGGSGDVAGGTSRTAWRNCPRPAPPPRPVESTS